MRNVWTQMASIAMSMCFAIQGALIVGYKRRGDLNDLIALDYALVIALMSIGLVWSLCFLFVVWAKRYLTPMEPKGLNMLETISTVVFLYWLISLLINVLTGFWALPILLAVWIWSIYLGYKYRRPVR